MTGYTATPLSAARLLRKGACIAYPTEAVWGLGCDPFNAHAVATLLRLKKRELEKGLILISGQAAHFDFLLSGVPQDLRRKVFNYWPSHTTVIVPHQGLLPRHISGGRDTVAIRVSPHPTVAKITRAFGGAIISTSANPAGKLAAKTRLKVQTYFRANILACEPELYVCQGHVGREQNASKIIDGFSGAVIREA